MARLSKKRAAKLLSIAAHAEVNLFDGSDLMGEDPSPEDYATTRGCIEWIREQAIRHGALEYLEETEREWDRSEIKTSYRQAYTRRGVSIHAVPSYSSHQTMCGRNAQGFVTNRYGNKFVEGGLPFDIDDPLACGTCVRTIRKHRNQV